MFGRSLGGAVAIAIANKLSNDKSDSNKTIHNNSDDNSQCEQRNLRTESENNAIHNDLNNVTIRGVILENTFTCMSDMVCQVMPILSPLVARNRPFHFLLRNTWNSDR